MSCAQWLRSGTVPLSSEVCKAKEFNDLRLSTVAGSVPEIGVRYILNALIVTRSPIDSGSVPESSVDDRSRY
eukprot:COSAG01_NODE_64448_length_276_cov_0.881356_1_plen_71_part_01